MKKLNLIQNWLLWPLLSLSFSACVHLERHPASGFASNSERGQALGQLSQLAQLEQAEKRLNREGTLAERRQYYRYRGLIQSPAERLRFLSLPTLEARERWALQKNLVESESLHSEEVASLIENKDIQLGMAKSAVQQAWGEPDAIEYSGDPIYGNERWSYSRLVGSRGGYSRQVRFVYFESGRVIGWESL